jgi:hypothetical protein
MSVVIPKSVKSKGNEVPTWLNPTEAIAAAQNTLKKIATSGLNKVAASTRIVLSYLDSKGKEIPSDSPLVKRQLALAAREGKQVQLQDEHGGLLQPYRTTLAQPSSPTAKIHSVAQVKQVSERDRQLTPSYAVDSTINRHLGFKALQALTDFAGKMGMYGARARYLKGDNQETPGKDYQGLRTVTAEISYMVGPKLNNRVVATIGIDSGDRFIFPKIFKDADGKEYPFEKEAVASLLAGKQFAKPERKLHRRTDLPTFKKPDPTRFRAI